MSDSEDSKSGEVPIEVAFSVRTVESSVDVPMEEWSSLEVLMEPENEKKVLNREGLYDPGDGEMCGEYVAMSSSSVLRHPYYNYPAIKDPGIEDALLKHVQPEPYPFDGQDLYLAVCKEMNQCPVKIFHKGLLESHIDLKYYCINPNGVRAMAKALQDNMTVESLDFTDNFLNNDACYHLGDMLISNTTITEINLRGCRIGHEGARRLFCSLPRNRTLQVLDLSYNKLGDAAMEYLGNAILFGLNIQRLNLSYNDITGKGVARLVEPFETHNYFTHLDLSWNKLFSTGGYQFLMKLSESTCLQDLNLSWNSLCGPRIGKALGQILLCPLLTKLNLSNNQLEEDAIKIFIESLKLAKKLHTLNLSYNPISIAGAYSILLQVEFKATKVKKVELENVDVDEAFLSLLENMKRSPSKNDLVVTYGHVRRVFRGKGPDVRETVLNRVEFLRKSRKNKEADLALVALQLQKENRIIVVDKDFATALQNGGVSLDEDLVGEVCDAFPAPSKNPKVKIVNINVLVDYIKRKWPDKKLPPTPPPEPEEPIEIVEVKEKKGKAKKGKGKKK